VFSLPDAFGAVYISFDLVVGVAFINGGTAAIANIFAAGGRGQLPILLHCGDHWVIGKVIHGVHSFANIFLIASNSA
jgi:hypothetical protein